MSDIPVYALIDTNRAAAAAYMRSSGLPAQLGRLTGDTAIQLGTELFGKEKPFSMAVTHAYLTEDDEYVLALTLKCIRSPEGEAIPYGTIDTSLVLSQKDANPGHKHQWYNLSSKIVFEEAPEGAKSIFDKLVEYHETADAKKVPFSKRQDEHRVWLEGTIRFTLAAGGKFGLFIDDLDVSDAKFRGSGGGADPKPHTSLTVKTVEDVSDLWSAPAASATQTSSTKTVRTGRRPK